LGEGEHERAITRFNQCGPLLRLGRLDDAQRVLEGCLHLFREADDVTNQAKALSALAALWERRGDRVQAVALARQALAVSDRLPDLANRSISHGNLSNCLDRSGETEEAARHLLAAIVYGLVMNHHQELSRHLHNLGINMRRAAPDPYELPRLADLLSRPEFDALKRVLEASGVDAEGLQGTIDGIVEQERQSVS
jgi:tetratricopeptide (TPR) repeat protein